MLFETAIPSQYVLLYPYLIEYNFFSLDNFPFNFVSNLENQSQYLEKSIKNNHFIGFLITYVLKSIKSDFIGTMYFKMRVLLSLVLLIVFFSNKCFLGF